MLNRLVGVVMLRASTFREIADDRSANGQAFLVVILVALITGAVRALYPQAAIVPGMENAPATTGHVISGALGSVVGAVIAWMFASWVLAFVAKIIFHGRTNTLEMLRVLGFTRVFEILGVVPVPVVGTVLAAAGFILSVIGTIIGIREAAEFDTGKAILTAIIAIIVYLIILFLLALAVAAVIAAIIVALAPALQ